MGGSAYGSVNLHAGPASRSGLVTSAGAADYVLFINVPLMSADQPPAPPPLRAALRVIAASVDDRIDQARLRQAA